MHPPLPQPAVLLGLFGLLMSTALACDLSDAASDARADLRSRSYVLAAQANDSPVAEGIDGTATVWELGPEQTLITLSLDSPETERPVGLVAHIHANSAETGGGIRLFLAPVDGRGGGGTSSKVIDRPYNELIAIDGHINVYEISANALVSQGDIGVNADGQTGAGLERVAEARRATYELAAHPNEGSFPTGVPATAHFIELTPTQTLVRLQLDDGPTGALLIHPAHIHAGRAADGGRILIYLSPLDGNGNPANDGAASKVVERSFDELIAFDGHINIHQSYGQIQYVIAQGNIGANGTRQ